ELRGLAVSVSWAWSPSGRLSCNGEPEAAFHRLGQIHHQLPVVRGDGEVVPSEWLGSGARHVFAIPSVVRAPAKAEEATEVAMSDAKRAALHLAVLHL